MMSLSKRIATRLESMLNGSRLADTVPLTDEESGSSHSRPAALAAGASRPGIARSADPVEVAATLPMLEALSRHLRETADDLQTSVVAVSSGFGGMAATARETVQTAQNGLGADDGLNSDQTINGIRNTLHELLSAVQDSSQLSSRLAVRIGRLEDVLGSVNASLRKVEKIADEARIVGLNGRLEAARAGVHGAAFNVVANETKNLGVHAVETSTSIRKLVDQLDESLKSVSEELKARLSLDEETAVRSQQTVSRLLDQLSNMHQSMTDSLHRTQAASECLTREIGKSVMALQFQDRVNQRIDHVVEALDAIRENLLPFRREASPDRVESRANDWRRWLESRATMKSERDVIASPASTASVTDTSDYGSVELF